MRGADGTRAARVDHIVDLMSTFAWDAAALRECCDSWDLSKAYVQDLAREAGRRINSHINEPEYVSAIVAQSLQRILLRSEETGDYKSAIAAGGLWHRIASLRSSDPGLLPSEVTVEPTDS